jgi:hypothetical protein
MTRRNLTVPWLACFVSIVACSSTSMYVPVMRPAVLNLHDMQTLCVGHVQFNDLSTPDFTPQRLSNSIEDLLAQALHEDGRFTLVTQSTIESALREQGIGIDAVPNRTSAPAIYKSTGIRGWICGRILQAQYDESVTSTEVTHISRETARKNVRMGIFRFRLLLTVYDLEHSVVHWSDTLEVLTSAESKALDRDPQPIDRDQLLTEALECVRHDFLSLTTSRKEQVLVTFLRDNAYPEIVQGIRSAAAGNLRSADSVFQALVDKSKGKPNEDILWYDLGVAQQYRNNFREATESFEKAARIRDHARYRQAIQDVLEMEREYQELTRQGYHK